MTYCCNRNQNFNKESSQSVLDVLVLDFQEVLGTVLLKRKQTRVKYLVYLWFILHL